MALTAADLTEALAPILTSIIGINNRLEAIDNRLDGIDHRLDGMDHRLDGIDDRLDGMDQRLNDCNVSVDELNVQVRVLAKKSENSVKGLSDALAIVPTRNGTNPVSTYPTSLAQLLVPGNELLPDGSKNTWNIQMSLELIREYDEGYETDNNDEATSSRRRRLHLAKLLGITTSQLNCAQMIL